MTDAWSFAGKILPRHIEQMNATVGAHPPSDRFDVLGAWIYDNGGAEVQRSSRRITLEGIDQKVVITGMRARVKTRAPVLSGGFLGILGGRGGGQGMIPVTLDLDQPDPVAPFFRDSVIAIGAHESVAIDLEASADDSTVTWDLVIDFIVGGAHRTMTISADSANLRTTGLAGVPDGGPRPPGYDLREHYRSLALFGTDVQYWTAYSPT
jgi:hypothetical protein